MSDRSARTLSRRSLLGGAGALAAAGVTGTTLTGCSDPTEKTNTEQTNVSATLPSYLPVELIKPDLPGNEVLMPGYYRYPRDPKPVFDQPPGAGLGTISIMYGSFVPAPPGPQKNAFYANLQKKIGAELDISFIPNADYGTKFQTMIAGGDLPDICNFPLPTPDQPRVMDKLFADLGPYLAGDAVRDYPYLANFPTASWKPTVSNGTVYAIPQPRAVTGDTIYQRLDILADLGLDPEPKNYDEFVRLMTDVTDAKQRRWAFATTIGVYNQLLVMLGAPNGWREEGGRFVAAVTDERSTEAVARVAELVKKGLFHPDTSAIDYARIRDLFFGGRVALTTDGYAGWDLFVRSLGGGAEGTAKLGLMVKPKAEGGGDAAHFARPGIQGITVIKKGLGEERTRKLLKVLDFLAAPIGSAEHLERKYGVEGTDFTWEHGLPTLTDTGTSEFMDLQYVTDAQTTIGPTVKEGVDRQYAWHKRISPNLVYDPTVGLYSDTYSRKGVELNTALDDARNDVFYGRKPLKSFTEAVQTWRKQGGDDIAAEYAAAREAAG